MLGASAFSHKGGLHVSAVQKDPKTYEHVEPELELVAIREILSSQINLAKSNISSPG